MVGRGERKRRRLVAEGSLFLPTRGAIPWPVTRHCQQMGTG